MSYCNFDPWALKEIVTRGPGGASDPSVLPNKEAVSVLSDLGGNRGCNGEKEVSRSRPEWSEDWDGPMTLEAALRARGYEPFETLEVAQELCLSVVNSAGDTASVVELEGQYWSRRR